MIRRVISRRNNHGGECIFLLTQQRFVTPSSGNNRPITSTGTNSSANSPADEYFSFTPDPKKPIDVLDAVLNTVSKRYGIPTNATDMRIGTIGAYRALGVLMQQYVTYLEKEGPSSPMARIPSSLSAKPSPASSSPPVAIVLPPTPLVSSLSEGGVVAPKEGSDQAAQAEEKLKNELLRKASFTSIVSFLVRTLFSKHATPMETQSIAEAINKQAEINRRARQKEFLEKLSSSTTAKTEEPPTTATTSTTEEGKAKEKKSDDTQVPDKHSSQLSSEPSSSSVEDNIKPEDIIDAMNKAIGSKGQAIVERHFPMTNNMRNLLNNFYHMPTHKMVPVLGSSGKGLGKEFRDYFAGGARVSLRFGKFTAGLYPASTLPPASQLGTGPGSSSYLGSGGAEIGTMAELTNVFEISHPRDNVIRASINAVRVDGTIIEASADEPVILDPIAYAWRRDNPEAAIANGLDKSIIVDKEFFEMIDKDVGAALNTLDRHRPKKTTAKTTTTTTPTSKVEEKSRTESKTEGNNEEDATKNVTVEELAKEMEGTFMEGQKKGQRQFTQWVGTSPNTKPGSKIELASFPHVSVDILMDVVVPPRRFVPDYEFYEERIIGGETQGQRNAVAKMLAIHSATRFTRFANKIYKMFTGKELKIDVTNNTTIEMLARRTGMDEIICVNDVKGNSTLEKDSEGNVIPKYPYESKLVTMVYCFKDKEWAVDNVKVLMNGSYN